MSYNLYVTNGSINIGVLPSSELTAWLGGNTAPDFDDIVNAWALYTRRTIENGSALSAILFTMPALLDRLIASATGFAPITNGDDFVEVPDPNTLEVVVLKGKDYYVIEEETLDYGLVDVTLHEVGAWHALWDDFGQEALIEENNRLVTEAILGTAFAGLTPRATAVVNLPPVVTTPISGGFDITKPVGGITAGPIRVSVRAADGIAYKTETVDIRVDKSDSITLSTTGSVSIGDGVQFADGFLGFKNNDPASAAQHKLAQFLSKGNK